MPQHASGSVSDINSHSVEIELIQILNNNGASAVYEKRRGRMLDRGLWNVRREKYVRTQWCRAELREVSIEGSCTRSIIKGETRLSKRWDRGVGTRNDENRGVGKVRTEEW